MNALKALSLAVSLVILGGCGGPGALRIGFDQAAESMSFDVTDTGMTLDYVDGAARLAGTSQTARFQGAVGTLRLDDHPGELDITAVIRIARREGGGGPYFGITASRAGDFYVNYAWDESGFDKYFIQCRWLKIESRREGPEARDSFGTEDMSPVRLRMHVHEDHLAADCYVNDEHLGRVVFAEPIGDISRIVLGMQIFETDRDYDIRFDELVVSPSTVRMR